MTENKKRFSAGQVIFSEGEAGDVMYIVIQGQVQVYRDTSSGRVVLLKAGPGQFFGEMALIGRMPRTATAVALSGTVVTYFQADELESLLRTRPDVGVRMVTHLIERLKETTDRYLEERHKRLGSW